MADSDCTDDPDWRAMLAATQKLCELLEPLPKNRAARTLAAVALMFGHDDFALRALRAAQTLEREEPHPR
jgi:Flp pilus assembly protein TadD